MKTAIIYATKTNHSKKLAEAMGSCLNIPAQNITENPPLVDIDLLFIVGGIYGGASLPELLEYIKNIEALLPKYAALVTSSATGKHKQSAVRSILEEKGIKVIDELICRGRILFVAITHPNARDFKAAVDFALKVVSTIED